MSYCNIIGLQKVTYLGKPKEEPTYLFAHGNGPTHVFGGLGPSPMFVGSGPVFVRPTPVFVGPTPILVGPTPVNRTIVVLQTNTSSAQQTNTSSAQQTNTSSAQQTNTSSAQQIYPSSTTNVHPSWRSPHWCKKCRKGNQTHSPEECPER
jgi:hypothetical protein